MGFFRFPGLLFRRQHHRRAPRVGAGDLYVAIGDARGAARYVVGFRVLEEVDVVTFFVGAVRTVETLVGAARFFAVECRVGRTLSDIRS